MLTNNSLSVVLEGAEQIAALRAKISIDKNEIETVEWHDVFSDWNTLLVRMPGSYLPRYIMAGSYWSEDGWDFVYAKRPKGSLLKPILHNVLVVQTKKDRYRRVILEMSNDNAREILAWWKEK